MTQGTGPPWQQGQGADVAGLRREVGRLRRQLEAHERTHEQAEREREREAAERARARRTTRRYWITTLATVVGSNLATLLLVAAHGHA